MHWQGEETKGLFAEMKQIMGVLFAFKSRVTVAKSKVKQKAPKIKVIDQR